MDIRTEIDKPYTVVVLPKRLDVTNTQQLLGTVRAAMGSGSDCFILDMGQTEGVDSTALGAIVSLYKAIRAAEGTGDLALSGVRDSVKRVLALTRLDKVFTAYDSVQEAKAAYARSAAPTVAS